MFETKLKTIKLFLTKNSNVCYVWSGIKSQKNFYILLLYIKTNAFNVGISQVINVLF